MSQITWDKSSLQALLDRSDAAVKRALLLIYGAQTDSEKFSRTTRDANKVGFSAFDAEILTSFAEQLIRRDWLSPKQLAITRNKIKRYWRQLLEAIPAERQGLSDRAAAAFGLIEAPVPLDDLDVPDVIDGDDGTSVIAGDFDALAPGAWA